MSQQLEYTYVDDAGFTKQLTDNLKAAGKIRKKGAHFWDEYIPALIGAYVFVKDHVKILQFFFDGGMNRCLAITGETGTGKTSLIEQACARLNWPLRIVSCHDRLTMFELVGGFRLAEGNTVWEDGPLIWAMRNGSVLLLDEINTMPPAVLTALNLVLERWFYLIPETGEVVTAHPDFRVVITGNALNGDNKGAYKGVAKMNIAFMNRFILGLNMDYLSKDQESQMLCARYPELFENVANFIVEIAGMSRLSCIGGQISAHPMSPRTTIAIAEKVVAYSGYARDKSDEERQAAQFRHFDSVFSMTYLWALNSAEKDQFVTEVRNAAKAIGVDEYFDQ